MHLFLVTLAVALAQAASPGPPADSLAYRPTLLIQIGVSDLDRSIRFYTGVLGFRLTERRDDLRFAHLATNVPGLEIGLSAGGPVDPSPSVVLNIGVTDVAAARAALERRGVVFPRPTQVIPGKVALAEFADPDGHRLRLAGPPARQF
jgi:catechol 2,3-dioxygenase-like lactoylglutathione lyase family enzyme